MERVASTNAAVTGISMLSRQQRFWNHCLCQSNAIGHQPTTSVSPRRHTNKGDNGRKHTPSCIVSENLGLLYGQIICDLRTLVADWILPTHLLHFRN